MNPRIVNQLSHLFLHKMNSLVIWENNTLSIRYFNKKYSLYDGDKLVVNDYDSLTPCIDSLFIAVMRENYSYKYQLLNINGEKVFGDEKKFEFIGFNHELNKFTFYDYFNKIDLVFPKLSEEKNKLFILFLRQIYRKKINDICEFQTIVDEIFKIIR